MPTPSPDPDPDPGPNTDDRTMTERLTALDADHDLPYSRHLVWLCLREHGPLSRTAIPRQSPVAYVTASEALNDLREHGLVRQHHPPERPRGPLYEAVELDVDTDTEI